MPSDLLPCKTRASPVLRALVPNWSMIVLGPLYTRTLVTTVNQALVRSGLYRVVRHPGYLRALRHGQGATLVLAPLAIAG
jgi:protein-S-isoprenylcysteine O-methyltransferase Ste14